MKAWLWAVLIAAVAVAPLRGDEPPAKKPAAPKAEPTLVPYRLSATKHVLVRLKLNGKGPFNFLLDTGSPTMFVGKKVAARVGIKAEKDGWARFQRCEIEGGLLIEKATARIEDLFQLEGMNGSGLAGVELHGVVGYNVLARYRIRYDFTDDKLAWTPLDYKPPPVFVGGGGQPAELEAAGGAMKLMGALLAKQKPPPPQPRGFLGLDLADVKGGVVVTRVLPGGPAATAGLKVGDRITAWRGRGVASRAEVVKSAERATAGSVVRVEVQRGEKTQEFDLPFGKGL